MAVNILQALVTGAGKQGLKNIAEYDEFLSNVVTNSANNVSNATATLNSEWSKDVETSNKEWNNYLAAVDMVGKDKADWIFENTPYFQADNWSSLVRQTAATMFNEDGSEFKYTARTEPVEVMTANINRNRSNVENQINNLSSMRGMKNVSNMLLSQLPEAHTFDTSVLPVTEQVPMTDIQRMEAGKHVILPTEIIPQNTQNMMHIAMINKTGGDIKSASEIYGVPVDTLQQAQYTMTEVNPFLNAALQLVDIADYKNKLDIATTADAKQSIMIDFYNEIETNKVMLQAINSDLQTGGGEVTKEFVISDLVRNGHITSGEGITDDTVITIAGTEYTFKDIFDRYKTDNA